MFKTNHCVNKNPGGFDNINCKNDAGVVEAFEQSAIDISLGYTGGFDSAVEPINQSYWQVGLCPVNVHWHLGAEHRSAGEFDEAGTGPPNTISPATPKGTGSLDSATRRLAGPYRRGFRCHKYDANDARFTTPYDWQHCVGMAVGETYEVHWPHSALGACGTPYQYQTPFYDGVFCHIDRLSATHSQIGVQGQTFVVINDETYYYPELFRGMIIEPNHEYGIHMARYTGSTTGTSRSNTICSKYTPITWQVDRKCHLISASSFDKMCADMKAQSADMSDDLYAHGSRILVTNELAADNTIHVTDPEHR